MADEQKLAELERDVEEAMRILNKLSCKAQDLGDKPLMYAANRCWNEFYEHNRGRNVAAPQRDRG